MAYASLMVHLDPGASNEGLLRVAGDLAERFDASVTGVAACQSMQVFGNDAYMSGELIEQDRLEMDKLIKEAEQRFRAAMQGRTRDLRWRSMIAFAALADCLASEARSADLILIAPDGGESTLDQVRRVSVGDLTMSLGRPMLIVPPGAKALDLDHMIVGWKDTREARRAASDALPLLKAAGRVAVVEIAKHDELAAAQVRVSDVVDWLKRHGVSAEPLATASTGDDASQLGAIVQEMGAGLLVAGAYGHSRLREWALGGVTRDLLLRSSCLSLVSH